jgi:iron complex transport system substrate-binding protein
MSEKKRMTSVIVLLVVLSVPGFVAALCALISKPVVRPSHDPHQSRIISLSPSTTEMLFVLGMGKSLVGATKYCNYPPEARKIERVGGFGTPNVEKVLSLVPDLVIGADLGRSGAFQSLQAAGLRVLNVRVNNIDEMLQALRDVGDAVGRRRQADEAIASMQADLDGVLARIPSSAKPKPPRVFVELWDDPLTTIGKSSYLDDVISRAGGVNIAGELSVPHPRVNSERVITWDPDVIVIAHMAERPCSPEEIARRIGWSDIRAVKRGMIVCDIPNDLILRPGPRLVELVKLLAAHLHKSAKQQEGTRQTP